MLCAGVTRAGHPCKISSDSALKDANGRPVGAPLRYGSPYCLFHTKPFVHHHANVSGPVVLLFLDLETTSTDVSTCRIVEIAAFQGLGAPMKGGSFAALVSIPREILTSPGAQAAGG